MRDAAAFYILANLNPRERIRYHLLLQCAPFLKGMRSACMVNIGQQYRQWFVEMMSRAGAAYRILGTGKERSLALLYQREQLTAYLNRADIREALGAYGYVGSGLDNMLGQLEERVERYEREKQGFPHEAGLFLQYPIWDVEGFVRFGGKNFLLSGYWKVYGQPKIARMTFLAFDKARTSTANELLSGKTITQIMGMPEAVPRKM